MASITLKHVSKTYLGNTKKSVDDFNMEIQDGEFIVFVGPSGCGKSTTLRMIAGLEDITDGELYIDGKYMNDVEPKDRNIAMVFQNYALYPHMTVRDNMTYGLKFRKVPKEEINRRVEETMKILDFDEILLKRRPGQLSGGQKQRVALGRAIVRKPSVFLMDEPLSNLDAKLRIQMRAEITRIHKQVVLQLSTLHTTKLKLWPWQVELLLWNKGDIQQIDTPERIYDYPENTFVAGFVGAPAMNFLNGTYSKGIVTLGNGKEIKLPEKDIKAYESYEGKEIIFGIRPEDCYIHEEDVKSGIYEEFCGDIENIELLGFETIHYLNDGTNKMICKVPHKSSYQINDNARFLLDMSKYSLFDGETKVRIKREELLWVI